MANGTELKPPNAEPTIETYPESEIGWVVGSALTHGAALLAAIEDWKRNPNTRDSVVALEEHAHECAWAFKELGLLEDFKRPDGELSVTDTERAREAKGLSLNDRWKMRWKRKILLEV